MLHGSGIETIPAAVAGQLAQWQTLFAGPQPSPGSYQSALKAGSALWPGLAGALVGLGQTQMLRQSIADELQSATR